MKRDREGNWPDDDGKFDIDDQDKKIFTRTIGSYKVKFEVYDSVFNFNDSHWSRVVALFTHGGEF
jgi:hypothetical protein